MLEVAQDKRVSVQALIEAIEGLAQKDERTGDITRDALLNRLQVLSAEPLGSILKGGPDALRITELMTKRVIFDLRHVARTGGMEAARLLYNLVAKRIFEAALRRGITSDLKHVVVLEEASNLIPESYARLTAADVTTGESMVMLQRATGQGVIVVSTRPNISSNVLANTATKFIFRLPYDSEIGARFLSLDSEQERYLRSSKTGRAMTVLPGMDAFEVAVIPFRRNDYMDQSIRESTTTKSKTHLIDESETPEETTEKGHIEKIDTPPTSESLDDSTTQLYRDGMHESTTTSDIAERSNLVNRIIAFLASGVGRSQADIDQFLISLDNDNREGVQASDVLRELVASSRVERIAVPLVDGGFVYALPGLGLKAVKETIIEYVMNNLHGPITVHREDVEDGFTELLLGTHAVFVFADHLKMSSMDMAISRIRRYMKQLSPEIEKLTVVVRGSIAASKLRELMDRSDEFDAVEVISAFPSSLQKMIQEIFQQISEKGSHSKSPDEIVGPETEHPLLPDERKEQHSSQGYTPQTRLWSELIQEFVELTGGHVLWEDIHGFIETTATQSLNTRSPPLSIEQGHKTLTEMLADETLIAVRVDNRERRISLEEGLWILNVATLQKLKEEVIKSIETELYRIGKSVSRYHEGYDLCAEGTSFVVFPTQQQLGTLCQIRQTPVCRICNSKQVICVLSAAEYRGDIPQDISHLTITTLDEITALAV